MWFIPCHVGQFTSEAIDHCKLVNQRQIMDLKTFFCVTVSSQRWANWLLNIRSYLAMLTARSSVPTFLHLCYPQATDEKKMRSRVRTWAILMYDLLSFVI